MYTCPGELMMRRCRNDDENTPRYTVEPTRPRCGESPQHIMDCSGLRRVREMHGIQGGCRVSEGPNLRLANFLLGPMRQAPGLPPTPRTTDAHRLRLRAGAWTRPAWIKACSAPKSPPGADRAARMLRRDGEGEGEPASRMVRLNSRMVSLSRARFSCSPREVGEVWLCVSACFLGEWRANEEVTLV